MKFADTFVQGVVIAELEPIHDERGFFARAWCARELGEHGLRGDFVQENVGFSARAGTLRGLHLQSSPHEEVKLVMCTQGAAWDVAVDTRENSPTFGSWIGVELTADARNMLYIPEGCAHGYITLRDDTELRYVTSAFYEPAAATGFRYDDPAFGIDWPAEIVVVSDRDRDWPFVGATEESPG
jgi:dTDP-4-dehydrorhamnose 3,5-epimerase